MFLIAMLNSFISDLVQSFNIGKNMNENQVIDTSRHIARKYYYLKPEDFKMCFDNAKDGVYGKQYDRLDRQVIIQWIETYCAERASFFEADNDLEHDKTKSENSKIVLPQVAEILGKIRLNIEQENSKEIDYKKFKDEYNKKQSE